MKTYKVTYSGNSTRFRNFESEINASSEREAVENIFQQVLCENYFPQGDGTILDCQGNELATSTDNIIEYDGGCFSAECIDLIYKVTFNFENGTSQDIQKFDNLTDAINCFDKAEISPELQERGADEIEIKKFRGEEIEDFSINEVPISHVDYISTGWFVKEK